MTDLMTPRFLVIANYPYSPFRVGEILNLIKDEGDPTEEYYYIDKNDHFIIQSEIEGYPRLFRKLEWWENREMSEMPDYVHNYVSRYSFKVIKWRIEYGVPKATIRGAGSISADWLTPRTKEEYEAYLKTIKK